MAAVRLTGSVSGLTIPSVDVKGISTPPAYTPTFAGLAFRVALEHIRSTTRVEPQGRARRSDSERLLLLLVASQPLLESNRATCYIYTPPRDVGNERHSFMGAKFNAVVTTPVMMRCICQASCCSRMVSTVYAQQQCTCHTWAPREASDRCESRVGVIFRYSSSTREVRCWGKNFRRFSKHMATAVV